MFNFLKDKELLKKFIKLAVPVMISSLITFLVNFLDNIMVGTISNEAVSAVYAANQITFLYQMGVFGVLEGAGIFVQQYNGKKDYKHISQCFKYKWIIILIFAIIAIPLIFLFNKDLIYIQCFNDANKDVILDEGMKYILIAAIGYIPFSFSAVFYHTLQETGNTKYPMYSSAIALITNTALNALLIFKFNMGVAGAAIATLVSRIVELLYFVILSIIKKFEFFKLKGIKIEKELAKNAFKKGSFLFINEMGFTIGVLLQNFAFSQRDGVLSSISIVSMINELFHVFGVGFAVGIGIIIGSNLGRDEFDKAKENTKKLIKFGVLITLFITLVLVLTSGLIPNLYKEVSLEQKELASNLIITLALALPFHMFALSTYYVLRSGGRTLDTLIFDTGSNLFLYVPISWILALLTDMPMLYIFIIIRFVDVMKALIGYVLLKRGKWIRNITINEVKL